MLVLFDHAFPHHPPIADRAGNSASGFDCGIHFGAPRQSIKSRALNHKQNAQNECRANYAHEPRVSTSELMNRDQQTERHHEQHPAFEQMKRPVRQTSAIFAQDAHQA